MADLALLVREAGEQRSAVVEVVPSAADHVLEPAAQTSRLVAIKRLQPHDVDARARIDGVRAHRRAAGSKTPVTVRHGSRALRVRRVWVIIDMGFLGFVGRRESTARSVETGARQVVSRRSAIGQRNSRRPPLPSRAMSPTETATLRFGPFALDGAAARLWRDGEPVELAPKSFDLLAFLAGRPGTLVTKDELLDGVWGTASSPKG